jgi:hypothetical protein
MNLDRVQIYYTTINDTLTISEAHVSVMRISEVAAVGARGTEFK